MHAQTQDNDAVKSVSDIPLNTLNGETHTLNEYLGKKPIYIKFWASWCIPCQEQMPHLQHSYEAHGEAIQYFAVNLGINDSPERLKTIQKEFGLTLPMIVDDSKRLAKAFQLKFTPYHVLIDAQGNLVHTGHDASEELDSKLAALAQDDDAAFTRITLGQDARSEDIMAALDDERPQALFFTSTWCHSYLKDSRPAMAGNCVRAQKEVNRLSDAYPQFDWVGIVTRLWTGDKELQEYRDSFETRYPMYIDQGNELFLKHQVKTFPTLVLITQGREIFRTSDFSDSAGISQALGAFDELAMAH